MIRQCAILFGCLALGELIVYLTGIKLPSSIIGILRTSRSSTDVVFRRYCGRILAYRHRNNR